MSSLASSFTEEYVTWDKVDASFPAKNISVYVAPGGSGVGVSAAIDGTCDFGMLARDIKSSEIEALGENYQERIVARDALTVSVNAKTPLSRPSPTLTPTSSVRFLPVRLLPGIRLTPPFPPRPSTYTSATFPAVPTRSSRRLSWASPRLLPLQPSPLR